MPFDVQQFRSVIDSYGGILRNNRFLATFAPPRKMRMAGSAQDLSFFCKSAPLPGVGILTQDIYRYGYGPIERRPYGTVVNDIMFHFYVDSGNKVRRFLREWTKLIVNADSSKGMTGQSVTGTSAYEIGYKEDYAVDVKVTAFSQEGFPRITLTLVEAYPNYIGDVQQDWEDKNSNMILPISLTFRDWYEDTIDESVPGTGGNSDAELQRLIDSLGPAPTLEEVRSRLGENG